MPSCVPISDIKDTVAFSRKVATAGEPVVITKNGHEQFVAFDAELFRSYRKEAPEHLDAFLGAANVVPESPEVKETGSHLTLARRGLRPYFVKRYVMLCAHDGGSVIVHRVLHTLRDCARPIGEQGCLPKRFD